jgi:hypothetical protein
VHASRELPGVAAGGIAGFLRHVEDPHVAAAGGEDGGDQAAERAGAADRDRALVEVGGEGVGHGSVRLGRPRLGGSLRGR